MIRTARLSPCGRYRYRLDREWGRLFEGPPLLWVLLNPSTADARRDDPTLRRLVSFSQREGAGRLIVVNLFALRATDPTRLLDAPDPVGPEADGWIDGAVREVSRLDGRIVLGWGAAPFAWRLRAHQVLDLIAAAHPLVETLGWTGGVNPQPRHPLRLSRLTPLSRHRILPRGPGDFIADRFRPAG